MLKPLSPTAARLLLACDRIFDSPPAGEVVELQFGQGVPVFGDVPFDSRPFRGDFRDEAA